MRAVIVADLHGGHGAGLTMRPDVSGSRFVDATLPIRREMTKYYKALVRRYRPVDLLICNGDAIDGRGERSGSTELITVDRHEQVEIALGCLQQWRAPRNLFTRGTGYHVGNAEEFENLLARELPGGEIHDQLQVRHKNVVINAKHKIGGSTVPYGRFTALAKAQLWSWLWTRRGQQEEADIFVRSHVHFHAFCGAPGWVAMSTPALQAARTKVGAKQCLGTVDWGITVIDIDKRGKYTWFTDTIELDATKLETVEV
jgi:hypothetical protein